MMILLCSCLLAGGNYCSLHRIKGSICRPITLPSRIYFQLHINKHSAVIYLLYPYASPSEVLRAFRKIHITFQFVVNMHALHLSLNLKNRDTCLTLPIEGSVNLLVLKSSLVCALDSNWFCCAQEEERNLLIVLSICE